MDVKSACPNRLVESFRGATAAGIRLLEVPLGTNGRESPYACSLVPDNAREKVTIALMPPSELIAGQAADAEGWVLGVQPVFPAA
jgi:hypothetical protein